MRWLTDCYANGQIGQQTFLRQTQTMTSLLQSPAGNSLTLLTRRNDGIFDPAPTWSRTFFTAVLSDNGCIMTTSTTVIGFVAAMLTTVAFLPQVVKVWKTQSAKDVSLGMYFILTIGVALWLVYGISIVSWPMIISNAITLVLASAVLGMKLKFG